MLGDGATSTRLCCSTRFNQAAVARPDCGDHDCSSNTTSTDTDEVITQQKCANVLPANSRLDVRRHEGGKGMLVPISVRIVADVLLIALNAFLIRLSPSDISLYGLMSCSSFVSLPQSQSPVSRRFHPPRCHDIVRRSI